MRPFRYFNFVGVVPSEFALNPSPQHSWETDSLEWVSFDDLRRDIDRNPDNYHPGLIALVENSHELIARFAGGGVDPEPEGKRKRSATASARQSFKDVPVYPLSNASDLRPMSWVGLEDSPEEPFLGSYTLRRLVDDGTGKGYFTVFDGKKPIAAMTEGHISVLPKYRKQGIALAMVKKYMQEFPNYVPKSLNKKSYRLFEKAFNELYPHGKVAQAKKTGSVECNLSRPEDGKTASPDFGYTEYNDAEEKLARIQFQTDKYPEGFEIVALNDGQREGSIFCAPFDPSRDDALARWEDINDELALDFCVRRAGIEEWAHGTGLGQMLYDKAIAEAGRQGAWHLYSDDDLSPYAKRAWNRLAKRYPVVKENGRYRLTIPESMRSTKTAARKQAPLTPAVMKKLQAELKELREEEGEGQCYTMAEVLENRFGWEKTAGFYMEPGRGHDGHSDHAWNVLNNGTIVDATHDQFGSPDVAVIGPSDPEYKRYHAYCGDYDCPICTCDLCNEGFAEEATKAKAKRAVLSKNPALKPDPNYLEGSNGWALFPDQRKDAYETSPIEAMVPPSAEDDLTPEENWVRNV